MDETKLKFEDAMQRLDVIVRLLEQGDAPLDESLTLFEEGSRLLKHCSSLLDHAEQKVSELRKGQNDEPTAIPFDTDI